MDCPASWLPAGLCCTPSWYSALKIRPNKLLAVVKGLALDVLAERDAFVDALSWFYEQANPSTDWMDLPPDTAR
jgi:hypothetical protein